MFVLSHLTLGKEKWDIQQQTDKEELKLPPYSVKGMKKYI